MEEDEEEEEEVGRKSKRKMGEAVVEKRKTKREQRSKTIELTSGSRW